MSHRALMWNQQTRELISAQKTSLKHNNKDPESPRVTFNWHASKSKVHKLHQRKHLVQHSVPLVPLFKNEVIMSIYHALINALSVHMIHIPKYSIL